MEKRPDSPQVAALRLEVERVFGRPVRTPYDFMSVAERIEATTREHISDSTVKRVWKSNVSYATVSLRTLNVLSAYAGYGNYEAFCRHLLTEGIMESEFISSKECVRSEGLVPGAVVEISWMPDRKCSFLYLGDCKYKVISALNSKIVEGDTFSCLSFAKGRRLYVDNLCHQGEMVDSYGMGMEHGLTSVKLLEI